MAQALRAPSSTALLAFWQEMFVHSVLVHLLLLASLPHLLFLFACVLVVQSYDRTMQQVPGAFLQAACSRAAVSETIFRVLGDVTQAETLASHATQPFFL